MSLTLGVLVSERDPAVGSHDCLWERLYKVWAKVFHPTGMILIYFRVPFLSAISVLQYTNVPMENTIQRNT